MSDEVQSFNPAKGSKGRKAFGRPSKYNDELLNDAEKYILGDETNIDKDGIPIPEWVALGHPFPSIEGLCLYIGITTQTGHVWKKEEEKKHFSDIVSTVMDFQCLVLMHGGYDGTGNSQITKLLLAKHGYTDKIENINTNTENKIIYIDPDEKAEINENIDDVVDG